MFFLAPGLQVRCAHLSPHPVCILLSLLVLRIFSPTLSSVCDCRVSSLLASTLSLSSLCCYSASSPSLCSLSSLLLCMSAAVSPNSNSVGVSFYLPHIPSSLFCRCVFLYSSHSFIRFRTHLIYQTKAAFFKNKSLSASQPSWYLFT